MKVITNISYLSNEVASTTLLSTNSFSPEMYNESRIKVTNKITNQFNVFIQAIQAVLSRAVGDSESSFKKTPNATRNELQSLIEAAQYIDFSKKYPVEKVTDQTGKVGTKLAMNLVDHIVVKADPLAASKLQDDYVILTVSDFSYGIYSIIISNRNFSNARKSFGVNQNISFKRKSFFG